MVENQNILQKYILYDETHSGHIFVNLLVQITEPEVIEIVVWF